MSLSEKIRTNKEGYVIIFYLKQAMVLVRGNKSEVNRDVCTEGLRTMSPGRKTLNKKKKRKGYRNLAFFSKLTFLEYLLCLITLLPVLIHLSILADFIFITTQVLNSIIFQRGNRNRLRKIMSRPGQCCSVVGVWACTLKCHGV